LDKVRCSAKLDCICINYKARLNLVQTITISTLGNSQIGTHGGVCIWDPNSRTRTMQLRPLDRRVQRTLKYKDLGFPQQWLWCHELWHFNMKIRPTNTNKHLKILVINAVNLPHVHVTDKCWFYLNTESS
jgi:hypothetical protein